MKNMEKFFNVYIWLMFAIILMAAVVQHIRVHNYGTAIGLCGMSFLCYFVYKYEKNK